MPLHESAGGQLARVQLGDAAVAVRVVVHRVDHRPARQGYFGTKEDAVLGAFNAHGTQVADTLRARPADEDDWTALRRALDTVIERYRLDPAGSLEMTRLVQDTPALCARQLEKQHGWRPALTEALAERDDSSRSTTLIRSVRAAAALDCLNVALDHWTASNGHLDLVDLLDEAFAALAPH
jgi:hypothetical protein